MTPRTCHTCGAIYAGSLRCPRCAPAAARVGVLEAFRDLLQVATWATVLVILFCVLLSPEDAADLRAFLRALGGK